MRRVVVRVGGRGRRAAVRRGAVVVPSRWDGAGVVYEVGASPLALIAAPALPLAALALLGLLGPAAPLLLLAAAAALRWADARLREAERARLERELPPAAVVELAAAALRLCSERSGGELELGGLRATVVCRPRGPDRGERLAALSAAASLPLLLAAALGALPPPLAAAAALAAPLAAALARKRGDRERTG